MDYGLITSEKESAVRAQSALTIGVVCEDACKSTGYLFDGHSYKDCECVKEFIWKVKLIGANIPKEAWSWSLEDIPDKWVVENGEPLDKVRNYIEGMEKIVEKGACLFMGGLPGVGKTFIGSIILKEALKKGYLCWYTQMATLRNLIMESVMNDEKKEYLHWIKNEPQFIFLDEMDKINKATDMESYGSLYLNEFFTTAYGRGACIIAASNAAIVSKGSKVGLVGLDGLYPASFVDRLRSFPAISFVGESFRTVDNTVEKLLGIAKVKRAKKHAL